MSKKNSRADSFDQCAFPGHICTCQEKKIMFGIQLHIISNRLPQQYMIKAFCFNFWFGPFDKLWKNKIVFFYCDCHGIPCIQPAENIYQFKSICLITVMKMIAIIKVLDCCKPFSLFCCSKFRQRSFFQQLLCSFNINSKKRGQILLAENGY